MPKKHLLIVVAALSALLMSSCSFLDGTSESGSVSFTIDKATAQKLLESSRSAANHARVADADLEGLSMDVYLKGDYSQSQTIEAKTGASVSFENLRKGSKVYVQADVYINEPHENQKMLIYTGSSDTIRVNPGQNKVTVNLKGFYYVWFDANGGEGDFAEQRIVSGSKATKPGADPVREGTEDIAYIFSGWYTSADGGQTLSEKPFDFSTPIKKDTVLYAGWVEKRIFTVSFDLNGGSGDFPSQRVVEGESVSAPETEPTREANADVIYTFGGWYTSDDGGESLSFEPFDFNSEITGDLVLYAFWSSTEKFTVSFDTNGGTGTFEDQKVVNGNTASQPKTNPVRGNSENTTYEFAGWFTSSDGGKTLSEKPFNFTATRITKDTVLYAGWKLKVSAGLDIELPVEEYEEITVEGPVYNADNGTYTFTAEAGYDYEWKFNGSKAGTSNTFTTPALTLPGAYDVILLATKTLNGQKKYYFYHNQIKYNMD